MRVQGNLRTMNHDNISVDRFAEFPPNVSDRENEEIPLFHIA